jgi:4-hydroxy-tetrahydrodipicolinate synthase
VFVNGHAGEAAALTNDERLQVIEFTRRHIGHARTLLAGIIAFSTGDAVRQAKEAVMAGAEVVVSFPPPAFAAGGTLTPDAPIAWVEALARAAGVPVSIFQYPLASGCGYPTDTLVEMAKIPGVIAIKEGSDTITAYEDNWRKVKAANSKIAILPSNFDWFLAQLAVGADGILSGLASLAPHLLIEIWRTAEKCDLAAMRRVNDRLYPIVRSIYGRPPRMDMHTRIKVGLRHLGVIACAMPRQPLLPVKPAIEADVVRTVDAANLRAHVRHSAIAAQ